MKLIQLFSSRVRVVCPGDKPRTSSGLAFWLALAVVCLWASAGANAEPTSRRAASPWVHVRPVAVKVFGKPHNKTGSSPHATTPTAPSPHATSTGQPAPRASQPKAPSSTGAPGKAGAPSLVEQQRQMAMRLNRKQTQVYQRLLSMIISPCCWTQSVALHSSKLSDAIKVDLQRRLLAGHTEAQIIAAYKARFGQRILSVPEKSYIFLIPLGASLVAILLVSFVILRWTQRKVAPSNVTPSLDEDATPIAHLEASSEDADPPQDETSSPDPQPSSPSTPQR